MARRTFGPRPLLALAVLVMTPAVAFGPFYAIAEFGRIRGIGNWPTVTATIIEPPASSSPGMVYYRYTLFEIPPPAQAPVGSKAPTKFTPDPLPASLGLTEEQRAERTRNFVGRYMPPEVRDAERRTRPGAVAAAQDVPPTRFPVGTEHAVHVNPDDPKESYLEIGPPRIAWPLVVLPPLIAISVWGYLAYAVWPRPSDVSLDDGDLDPSEEPDGANTPPSGSDGSAAEATSSPASAQP